MSKSNILDCPLQLTIDKGIALELSFYTSTKSLTVYLILSFHRPLASPFEEAGGICLWHEDLPQSTFSEDEHWWGGRTLEKDLQQHCEFLVTLRIGCLLIWHRGTVGSIEHCNRGNTVEVRDPFQGLLDLRFPTLVNQHFPWSVQ